MQIHRKLDKKNSISAPKKKIPSIDWTQSWCSFLFSTWNGPLHSTDFTDDIIVWLLCYLCCGRQSNSNRTVSNRGALQLSSLWTRLAHTQTITKSTPFFFSIEPVSLSNRISSHSILFVYHLRPMSFTIPLSLSSPSLLVCMCVYVSVRPCHVYKMRAYTSHTVLSYSS